MQRSSTVAAAVLLSFAAAWVHGSGQTPPAGRTDRPDQHAPYFGQPPPGMTPVRFAPGIVSTDGIEINGVVTPDGREFFFSRRVDGVFGMYRSVLRTDGWSAPQPLMVYPSTDKALAVDMAVSPDGEELYFLGQHRHQFAPKDPGFDIWVSRRKSGEWTTAQVLPPPVTTNAVESYPSVVADGSLYFSSDRPGTLGRSDLYRAQRLADGKFAEPVNLGPQVNTEFSEGDTFVAPDESYMILTSNRPGGLGGSDLYVSFRERDRTWTKPVNLGATINSDQIDFCPMVTPDGKYLFFSRRWGATWESTTQADVYWVDARVLEPFRRAAG